MVKKGESFFSDLALLTQPSHSSRLSSNREKISKKLLC